MYLYVYVYHYIIYTISSVMAVVLYCVIIYHVLEPIFTLLVILNNVLEWIYEIYSRTYTYIMR